MKLRAAVVMAGMCVSMGALADPVAPGTDLASLQNGFTLVFAQPGDRIPVNSGKASVFVVQGGALNPGIWAWRGDEFFVLTDAADPSTDVRLDAGQASCQVHYDGSSGRLPENIRFKPMEYSGQAFGASLYTALSDPGEKVFLNCLTAKGAAKAPLLAGDLMTAWGARLAGIVSN